MEVRQGEVYHVALPEAEDLPDNWGSGPKGRHPVVVIQHDSRIVSTLNTVVVCVVTGTTDLGDIGGNVPLSEGEANLRKDSVVNVSQIISLDKAFLGRLIGQVELVTMQRILECVRRLLEGYKFPE